MWEVEEIPNDDFLYVRIADSFIRKDMFPNAQAFGNTPKNGSNLSSDWNKYCTPESSKALIGKQIKGDGTLKDPSKFYIWKFNVETLRKIEPKQIVNHAPTFSDPEVYGIPNNRAHSIIIGDKPNDVEFRALMVISGEWAISPESDK